MKEKVATRIIIQLFIQILSALASYFLLKNLTVEIIGIQGDVATTIKVFSVIYFVGLDIIYVQRSGDDNFSELFSNYLIVKLGLLLLSVLPLIFYIFIIGFFYLKYFFLMLIATMLLRIGDLYCLNLRAKTKIMKGEIIEFVSSLGLALVKLIISIQIDKYSDPLIILAWITLIFYGLKLLLSIVISKQEVKYAKLDKKKIYSLIKDTLPIVFSTMIIFLTDNLGVFIISISYNYEEFGYFYGINSYIIILITSITLSLAIIYQTYYSIWLNQDQTKKIKKFTQLMEKYNGILYFMIITITFVLGESILVRFLPAYLPGLKYLYILIFVPLIAGINRPFVKLLYAGKKQKLLAKYFTISRCIYLLFMVVLIPPNIGNIKLGGFSAIGVCFLQVLINLIDYIVYRYYTKKYFNLKYNYNMIFIFFASIIVGLTGYFIFSTNIFSFNSKLLELSIKVISLGILFLIILIIFNQITIDDYLYLRELLRFKNYKRSLNEEFSTKLS
jgi:O-antigen/teichoic acid export membrane protein